MTVNRDSSELSPRRLTTVDAPNGVRLSTQAGWNQVVYDWNVMIRKGHGICLVDPSDGLIATSILLPFHLRVDWVCMVLVDSSWRGQGIGSRLMRLVVELSPNPLLGLDATDQGIPLYERLGFVAAEGVTRYCRPEQVGSVAGATASPEHRMIAGVKNRQFQDLLTRFAPEAHKKRLALLEILSPARGGKVCLVHNEKTVAVASIRPGRTAVQIGPIYATDADSSAGVLQHIAASRNDPLIVDVHDRHADLVAQLSSFGFKPTRHFTRMFRGGMPPTNPLEYATAGPEFG